MKCNFNSMNIKRKKICFGRGMDTGFWVYVPALDRTSLLIHFIEDYSTIQLVSFILKKLCLSQFSVLCVFFCKVFAHHASSYSIHPSTTPQASTFSPCPRIPFQCHFWDSVTFHPFQMSKLSNRLYSIAPIMLYWTFIISLIFTFIIFSFLDFLVILLQKSISVANNLFSSCTPKLQLHHIT